jgi:7-cyano-7-deazaguanine synthase in queuosine biosynthesis
MTIGVVARLGSDTSPLSLEVERQHDVRFGVGSDISLQGLSAALDHAHLKPTSLAREFLIFAATVFVADTRIQRRSAQDGWTREIAISIPVNEVDRWEAARSRLERAIRFLTGDLWTFHFRQSAVSLPLGAQHPIRRPGRVALFSGGLDSFIGALDSLQEAGRLILVGHHADGATSTAQHDAYACVTRRKTGSQELSLIQSYVSASKDCLQEGDENTQRSRSVLFIALGILVASSIETTELIVPENGFISLNVPLTDLRVGSYSTRTTHPHFMSMIQSALRDIGLTFTLSNPYQFKTKGEMLSECQSDGSLLDDASVTMSCAHPTASRWTKGSPAAQHCGRCTACIIRRAAFQHAFNDDATDYTTADLYSTELDSATAVGRDIRALRLAARRVIDAPEVAKLLILKSGPLDSQYDRYADLYLRGMRELWYLLDRVRTRGAY